MRVGVRSDFKDVDLDGRSAQIPLSGVLAASLADVDELIGRHLEPLHRLRFAVDDADQVEALVPRARENDVACGGERASLGYGFAGEAVCRDEVSRQVICERLHCACY